MSNSNSSPLRWCLEAACAGQGECAAFPGDVLYQALWVKPYNLEAPVMSAAVVRPGTAAMVAEAVKCAVEHGRAVQARSGGDSYGNFGLGGHDGFSMDEAIWVASFGTGLRLGELDRKLHDNGRRAVPHGTCPGVGVGGQEVVVSAGPARARERE